ncbi:MAG: Holliday junction resolvase RuvX [Moorellales bacterium]
MRILGLDVGEKNIGVAVSDPLGVSAQPLTTLRRVSREKDLAAISDLVKEYEVEEVVVGLPLRLDGREGPEAEKVRRWGERLERHLGVPVRYWDERLTTVEAEQTLLAADLSRRRRRATVDRTAACLILQGYLDRYRQPAGEGAPAGTSPGNDVDRLEAET